ncbi:MAG: DUF1893 domain-containing protein [Synergistaceae bacterium]
MEDKEIKVIEKLEKSNDTLIAMREEIYYIASGLGVKPIIEPMRENKNFFENAFVADKVIGKGASLLLVLSKAKFVYGNIMSTNAKEVLSSNGIKYSFKTEVPYIKNRAGDGICPLEQSVISTDDPAQAFVKIENTIKNLMANKNK